MSVLQQIPAKATKTNEERIRKFLRHANGPMAVAIKT